MRRYRADNEEVSTVVLTDSLLKFIDPTLSRLRTVYLYKGFPDHLPDHFPTTFSITFLTTFR